MMITHCFEDYCVLVYAILPCAYISCESGGCDEGLIGLCLAAPSCLDDDKWLTHPNTQLDNETHIHTKMANVENDKFV